MVGETTLQAVAVLVLPALVGFGTAWFLRGRRLLKRATGAESALAAARRTCDDLKRAAAAAEDRLATLDAEHRAAEAAHADQASRLRLEVAAARRAKTELLSVLENDVRHAKQAYERRLAELTADLARLRAALAAEPPAARRSDPAPSAGALDGKRPEPLPAPEGQPDDLKKIHGVGPKLERNLNRLGIYHYRQIAGLTAENVAWVDSYLKVRGRIERQNWVAQARVLASKPAFDRPAERQTDDVE